MAYASRPTCSRPTTSQHASVLSLPTAPSSKSPTTISLRILADTVPARHHELNYLTGRPRKGRRSLRAPCLAGVCQGGGALPQRRRGRAPSVVFAQRSSIAGDRSEDRRGGQECVCTSKFRWLPNH